MHLESGALVTGLETKSAGRINLHQILVVRIARPTSLASRAIASQHNLSPNRTMLTDQHLTILAGASLGNGRNTVSRVLFRRRELTEFCGKLGEFCEKLGEFAFAHK